MNKILFLLLVSLFIVSPVMAETSTIGLHDLRLQEHDVLVYYANGSLLGEFTSNESFSFNNSQDLNIHLIPNRMDAVTAGRNLEGLLWGYLPFVMVAVLIILIISILAGFVWAILTGRLG